MAEGKILDKFDASIRNHLGELADVLLGARIRIAQKLSDQIAVTTDLNELVRLRAELGNCIISDEDIISLDKKIGSLIEIYDKHFDAVLDLRTKWLAATDPHGPRSGRSDH